MPRLEEVKARIEAAEKELAAAKAELTASTQPWLFWFQTGMGGERWYGPFKSLVPRTYDTVGFIAIREDGAPATFTGPLTVLKTAQHSPGVPA